MVVLPGCNSEQTAIEPTATTGSRPNIIFILTDDLSCRDLNIYDQKL